MPYFADPRRIEDEPVTIKVGINGFGRIGRNFLRAAIEQNADIQIVGVNDLTDNASLANLIKYDSIGGVLPLDVSHDENSITVGDQVIKAYAEDRKSVVEGKRVERGGRR